MRKYTEKSNKHLVIAIYSRHHLNPHDQSIIYIPMTRASVAVVQLTGIEV